MSDSTVELFGGEYVLVPESVERWNLKLNYAPHRQAPQCRTFTASRGATAKLWAETWLKMFADLPAEEWDPWLSSEDASATRCDRLNGGWLLALILHGKPRYFLVLPGPTFEVLGPNPDDDYLDVQHLTELMRNRALDLIERD